MGRSFFCALPPFAFPPQHVKTACVGDPGSTQDGAPTFVRLRRESRSFDSAALRSG